MEKREKDILVKALRSYRHWIGRLGAVKLMLQEFSHLDSVQYDRPNVQRSRTSSRTEIDAQRLAELQWEAEQLPKLIKLVESGIEAMNAKQKEFVDLRFVLGYKAVEIKEKLDLNKDQYYRLYVSSIKVMYEVVGNIGILMLEEYLNRKRAA